MSKDHSAVATCATCCAEDTHYKDSLAERLSEDAQYDAFLAMVASADLHTTPLFTTDASHLWEAYLEASPEHDRQHRTCHTCKTFIERFGGLVVLDQAGVSSSAFWHHYAPPAYAEAAQALKHLAERAHVTGVFLTSEATLGVPETGKWRHLSAPTPPMSRWSSKTLSASERMAVRREEKAMLERSLEDFGLDAVRMAESYLRTGQLARSEKLLEAATWLRELHERLGATKNQRVRTNLLWQAVASAPSGWAHVRSGMLGALLTDIEEKLSFARIKARFDEKMDPARYLRPQAPPKAGAIAEAEKIVEQLRSAGSLERRFARLSEVPSIWQPRPAATQPTPAGVFGHLVAGAASPPLRAGSPSVTMTWAKFERNVLPTAAEIELLVPPVGNFAAYMTASNPEAPPILQWDRDDVRNPVSWYCYTGGSTASRWGLVAHSYRRVTALVEQPSMWDRTRNYSHHGEAVCFVLDGAKDPMAAELGLFPEILKAEYHAVRSVIEAYSRKGRPTGHEEASVCGLRLQKGTDKNTTVRVLSRGVWTIFNLDRWD